MLHNLLLGSSCVYLLLSANKQRDMKAIIPVAGIGSRLRPHTHTQPKALVPVAGKPIIAHIIDRLRQGGITDFVFVTGYLRGKIEAFITEHYGNSDLNIRFVLQEPREGTGHALWVAREHFKAEPEMLIMLGDSILSLDFTQFMQLPHNALAVKKVDNPVAFGVAESNDVGKVTRLVEKPKIPKSNMALAGLYKIADPALLYEALEHNMRENVRSHNEIQLTDALSYMIGHGAHFETTTVDSWYDCGKKESLLDANAILLARPDYQSALTDQYPHTIIIPPVSIGQGCEISHSIIGPNVALGDHSTVRHTIVSDTIVGSYSELQHAVLHHSVIGSDTTVGGLNQSLNVGDNTEINFSNHA